MSEKKDTVINIKKMFNIFDGMMSYEEIDEMMNENTIIQGPNMWILMMAILIASIGLNMNSTAVIIGAMLISPLMGGIMTMGYSLAVRDLNLLKRALVRFGIQVFISLATSTLYFLITPLQDATSEMIARTTPTIWDVLIAITGGIAGMIGNTRSKKGNVIPGVAIATALMPPLCTTGYGIATGQPEFFIRAFYLFVINTMFIAMSSYLVALILKVPYHKKQTEKQQKLINVFIAVIVTVVLVPSIIIGAKTVNDTFVQKSVDQFIEKEFRFENTSVVKSSYDTTLKQIEVSLLGSVIEQSEITRITNLLSEYNLDGYVLRVTQNDTTYVNNMTSSMMTDKEQIESDKKIIIQQEYTISSLNEQIDELNAQVEEKDKLIEEYEGIIGDTVDYSQLARDAEEIFPDLIKVSCGEVFDEESGTVVLMAVVKDDIEDSTKELIKNWLKKETGCDSVMIRYEIYTEEDKSEEKSEDTEI